MANTYAFKCFQQKVLSPGNAPVRKQRQALGQCFRELQTITVGNCNPSEVIAMWPPLKLVAYPSVWLPFSQLPWMWTVGIEGSLNVTALYSKAVTSFISKPSSDAYVLPGF